MKKTIRHFTLVEMLGVIAIIGILAGLIIPSVIIAKNRGQITQAKSDITSISTALKQLKSDYNRILLKDGVINGSKKIASSDDICTTTDDTYMALIAELSVPKNSGLDQTPSTRINKRKKVYLDPKNGFNPAVAYNDAANIEKLWRDPWGNCYVIHIKVKDTDKLEIPGTKIETDKKTIASDIAIYSTGPNGDDDCGCNASLETCIKDGDKPNHKNHDDIASWDM